MKILISIILLVLFSVGVFLIYPDALDTCKAVEFNVCVLRQSLIKLPTWLGAFIGIFVSTYLAYQYSLLKQTSDDIKKKNQTDLDELNKLLLIIIKCETNLGALKLALNTKLESENSILRTIFIPYMISTEHKTIECNPEKYAFLNNHTKIIDPISPRNPTRINNIIENYNTTITLYKMRNDLALAIHKKAFSSDFNKLKTRNKLELFCNKEIIPPTELINFVSVSEQLLSMLDQTLEELELFAFEMPLIAKSYFEAIGFKKILIYSASMMIDENKEIFVKYAPIDIDSELPLLYKRFNEQKYKKAILKYPSIIFKPNKKLMWDGFQPPHN